MTMPGPWIVQYESLKTFYVDAPQARAGEPLPEQLAAARKKAERVITSLNLEAAVVTIGMDAGGALTVSVSRLT